MSGERDTPCSVIAGVHHDHLLVAADRREDTLDAIARLGRPTSD